MAPSCFSRLSDAVSRMMKKRGYICQNYLDDFICYGNSYDQCVSAQLCLIKILRRLGFYINWAKVASPSKQCRYLGLLINSEDQLVSLPVDKLQKVRGALVEIGRKKKVKKKKCVGCVAYWLTQVRWSEVGGILVVAWWIICPQCRTRELRYYHRQCWRM